jgi:glutathione S-transferase
MVPRRQPWATLSIEFSFHGHCLNKIMTANGRIPAIVDNTREGKPKRVFEGASIQLYLCQKYDEQNRISFEFDSDEYWECVEWMVWMVCTTLERNLRACTDALCTAKRYSKRLKKRSPKAALPN